MKELLSERGEVEAAPRGLLRTFCLLLAIPLFVGALTVLIQLLAINPYPEMTRGERLDSAELCLQRANAPQPDCQDFRPVTLPHVTTLERGTSVVGAHYRLSFDRPVSDDLLAFVAPRVTDHARIEVNGIRMSPNSEPDGPLWHDWNRPIYGVLPGPVLRPGTNQIDITLTQSDIGRLALYPVYVGEADAIRLTWLTRFAFRTGMVRMNIGLAAILGAAFFALWRMNRRGQGLGWLPLAMAGATIFGWQLAYPNVAPPGPWWKFASILAMHGTAYCLYMFLRDFFQERSQLAFVAVHATIAAGLAILVAGHPVLGISAAGVSFIGVAVAVICILWILISTPLLARVDRFVLVLLFSLSASCGVTAWLDSFMAGEVVRLPLGQVAVTLLFAGISWTLVQWLVEMKRQRDRLSESLRDQVRAKSAELDEMYRALSRQKEKQVVAQERQRIMLDLHDGIGGQQVNTLAYLENSGRDDPVLRNALEDALGDMALMIDSLHSDVEISAALGMIRNRLEPLLDRHHARFEWKVEGDPRFDNPTRSKILGLMRIVQEAITNAVKHSGADVITVQSGERDIWITDNGSGFDPLLEAHRHPSESGLGLKGMRQRSADIGVTLEIETSNKGTSVHLSW